MVIVFFTGLFFQFSCLARSNSVTVNSHTYPLIIAVLVKFLYRLALLLFVENKTHRNTTHSNCIHYLPTLYYRLVSSPGNDVSFRFVCHRICGYFFNRTVIGIGVTKFVTIGKCLGEVVTKGRCPSTKASNCAMIPVFVVVVGSSTITRPNTVCSCPHSGWSRNAIKKWGPPAPPAHATIPRSILG